MEEQIPGEDIVKVIAGADVAAAGLTNEEGFVLSRIDGETTVEILCTISGIGESETLTMLRRLREKGLIVVEGSAPKRRPAVGREARRATRGGSAANAAARRARPGERERSRRSTPGPSIDGRADEPASAASTADETAADESTLLDREESEGVDLKREQRIRIREISRQLGTMTFFELLEVSVDADARALRRAYFRQSKEFHPDRYYTRNLGPYKAMLSEIFRQMKAAYEFLQDDSKREAYRKTVVQQQEQEQLESEVRAETDRGLSAVGATSDSDPGVHSGAEEPVPGARPRTASGRAASILMKRQLRERFGGRRPSGAQATKQGEAQGSGSSPRVEVQDAAGDHPARATRRQLDRIRQQRRRRQTLVVQVGDRADRAKKYYEQGVQQLEEGKLLAAAASLRLATTFDPNNGVYAAKSREASLAAGATSAENDYKRALFEESVGRWETASHYFIRAADAHPDPAYLCKAVTSLLHTRDLIKAKEYATKAIHNAPNSAQVRLAMARVYLATGAKTNARREVEVAQKIEPGLAEAKELLKEIKRS